MPKPKPVDIDALLDDEGNEIPKGRDIRSLGPSDSSDTGADMVGVGGTDSTTDRHGTGERASVENEIGEETDTDIGAVGIVDAEDAGLGGGLDQAEEAQIGVTDEQIEQAVRDRLRLER
ncbi:MAG TPA: hypothetical protein VFP37_05950 [Steroidobacteraceae bacterium]|nr:hypothetical protein [Steroidobacteraceae bacterium]